MSEVKLSRRSFAKCAATGAVAGCLAGAGAYYGMERYSETPSTMNGTAPVSTEDFTFVVFGDSRLPGYLPYSKAEESVIRDLLRKDILFNYGSPELADRVDLSFDDVSGELTTISLTDPRANVPVTFFYEKGWIRRMVNGQWPRARVSLRSEGGQWVMNRIVHEITRGDALFALHTGDIVYWGAQGQTLDESPYWQLFHDTFLSRLPPLDKSLKENGLRHRFFPALGNHESWEDPEIKGVLTTMPYLQELGVTSENRIYRFDYGSARFIFLDTGDFDYRHPSDWTSTHPVYEKQADALKTWLGEARAKGIRHVFISFHAPAFCLSDFGPLPDRHNPHSIIKEFGSELEITVFNGHDHDTELFFVDGVRYLVVGCGGAEEDYRTIPPPVNYPRELYWEGEDRVEEYNYVIVHVSAGKTGFWIHRFRPDSPRPFQKLEIFTQ